MPGVVAYWTGELGMSDDCNRSRMVPLTPDTSLNLMVEVASSPMSDARRPSVVLPGISTEDGVESHLLT